MFSTDFRLSYPETLLPSELQRLLSDFKEERKAKTSVAKSLAMPLVRRLIPDDSGEAIMPVEIFPKYGSKLIIAISNMAKPFAQLLNFVEKILIASGLENSEDGPDLAHQNILTAKYILRSGSEENLLYSFLTEDKNKLKKNTNLIYYFKNYTAKHTEYQHYPQEQMRLLGEKLEAFLKKQGEGTWTIRRFSNQGYTYKKISDGSGGYLHGDNSTLFSLCPDDDGGSFMDEFIFSAPQLRLLNAALEIAGEKPIKERKG